MEQPVIMSTCKSKNTKLKDEINNLIEKHLEELKINFILACKALDDLSFSCFAGIGISAPTLKVYNETFAVLEKMRPLCKAMLPAAPTTNISTNT